MAEPSMVERVARAVCTAKGVDPGLIAFAAAGGTFDRAAPPNSQQINAVFGWNREIKLAKAVIAAMREPTPAMLEEGDCLIPACEFDQLRARTIWDAMIDEALRGD